MAGYGSYGGSWSQGSDSWSQGNSGGGWSRSSSGYNNYGQGQGYAGNDTSQTRLTNLSIDCQNASMVASIVRGTYTLQGENHGKSSFKKGQQVSGLDVILYFWDDRDGAELCGWYVGPEIGGNQVWAFIPSKDQSPPQTGWQVPYGGPVDPSFKLSYGGGAQQTQSQPPPQQPPPQQQQQQQYGQQQYGQQQSQQQQWQQQPQQQQWGQQQQHGQQSQQSWDQQKDQKQDWSQQKQDWSQQKQDWNRQSSYSGSYSGNYKQQDYARRQQDEQSRKREEWEQQRAEAQAKKEAEAKAAQDKMQAQREALQRRKEEMRQKQEAEFKAKQDAIKAKQEAEERKLQERKSAIAVRRVIQKVRVATADSWEALKTEMEEIFQTESVNLGSMLETITDEKDKALEGAQTRIETILEKKRKEEEAKAAMERKKKEAEELAAALLEEFTNMIDSTDSHSDKLEGLVKPLEEESLKDAKKASIDKAVSDFEEAAAEARAILKQCADFVKEKGQAMQMTPQTEVKQKINEQTQRVTEIKKKMEATIQNSQGMVDKAKSKSSAMGKTEKLAKLFKVFDKDKDGFLSQLETKNYCRTALKFTPTTDAFSSMWPRVTEDGAKGVAVEGLTLLKMLVGIEKEKARDATRKKDREDKERVIKEMKDLVLERVKGASQVLSKSNKEMVEIEEKLREAFSRKERAKSMNEMLVFAGTLDKLAEQGQKKWDLVQKTLKDLTAGADKKHESDLRVFLKSELKPLETNSARFGMRVARARKVAQNFRSLAKRKTGLELKRVKKETWKVVKYNQRLRKQEPEEFYASVDTKGDGLVDEEEWLEFFQYAEYHIRELFMEDGKKAEKAKAEEAKAEEGETETEKKEEDAKEEKTEEETKEEEEEELPLIELVDLGADDLTNVFRDLAVDDQIPKEVFQRAIRHTMKVASSTVMTDNMSLKDTQQKLTSVRRLETGEVVEVLLGPMKDKVSGVSRVKARAIKDGAEGWITVAGSTGTTFLTDGGSEFKVMKQMPVTDHFEVEENGGESEKEQLKLGTIVEVLELPRKEEQSGDMRMKVQVRGGGPVGWVTSASKSGIAFLQPV